MKVDTNKKSFSSYLRRKEQKCEYYSPLKGWINRFNGVATKYLDHYLSWFQFLDNIRHRNNGATVSRMIVKSFFCSQLMLPMIRLDY